MKRRTLLLAGLGSAGALLVGFAALPPRSRLGSGALLPPDANAVALNGWLRITPAGVVQLAMPRAEMGQGVHTALAMLVAEELSVPLARIELIAAGHDAIYGNVAQVVASAPAQPRDTEPGRETRRVRVGRWVFARLGRELSINATGGSTTIADLWQPLRVAAATARGQLLGAASLQWKLPVDELTLADGVVRHAGGGEQAPFGALVALAARTPPGDARPKPREQWRLVGTAAPRIDVPAKCDGRAIFGCDVRLPDLLYAVVRHAPALGGSPGAMDTSAALALPGVERVVRLGPIAGSTPALAVVGRSTWHARRGADALQVAWQGRPAGGADTRAIARSLEASARSGAGAFVFAARGEAPASIEAAPTQVQALYRAPYLAHATMEPPNATAQVRDGHVDVWAPTQVPQMARALAARVAGVPESAVTVHMTLVGGGFGRRLETDVVGQAVRVALETGGRPVQLMWPREEDLTHDFYRPAGAALLHAALAADGMPVSITITSAGDAPSPRWMERTFEVQRPWVGAALRTLGDTTLPSGVQSIVAATLGSLATPDKTANEGLHELPYDVAHLRVAHVATRHAVPVGFWRSVGHSHHAFFVEGFIDELAQRAKRDPVAYRLALLGGLPRHAAVLQRAADEAGWGTPLPAGRARGVALHASFGSIVAQVAEVSLVDGKPRVHRVVCAIDCGTVVNPGIVAQQMESGIVFGLTAALHGRIDIADGVVAQRNFPDQPLLALRDLPRIETHIVPSTNEPAGVGEPGTPPIAPAVANALFALTGQRLRELPLRLA